jgi:hypothetical protein
LIDVGGDPVFIAQQTVKQGEKFGFFLASEPFAHNDYQAVFHRGISASEQESVEITPYGAASQGSIEAVQILGKKV